MSKGAINYSNDNEYYTPKNIVDYFGKFDYDPATTKEQAEYLEIENYDTIETDGLKTDWSKYKTIWINPPFTKKGEFLEKAYRTFKESPYIYIYMLIPVSYLTTKKFWETTKKVGAKIFIPKGRINFISNTKETKSPAFGSVIIKIQNKWEIELIDIKE